MKTKTFLVFSAMIFLLGVLAFATHRVAAPVGACEVFVVPAVACLAPPVAELAGLADDGTLEGLNAFGLRNLVLAAFADDARDATTLVDIQAVAA